jgi:hypothetical protein
VLPEILELLGQQSKWAGTYHGDKGKRFGLGCFGLECQILKSDSRQLPGFKVFLSLIHIFNKKNKRAFTHKTMVL